MSRLGFTGSRQGMTFNQSSRVGLLLDELFEPYSEFHHGNCVGADEQALALAQIIGYRIVAHPANNLLRLQLSLDMSDEARNDKAPIARNKAIVDETSVLIAAPKETTEPPVRRGQGTWSTVRYARKIGAPYVIVWPNGETGA